MRQNLGVPLAASSAGTAAPQQSADGRSRVPKARNKTPRPRARTPHVGHAPPAAGLRLPSGRGRAAALGSPQSSPTRRARPAAPPSPRGRRSPPPAGGEPESRIHLQRRHGARCRPPGLRPPAEGTDEGTTCWAAPLPARRL
ncbi:uncharacterized protein LOC110401228 isoform X2 [Numida meleagris]|uniref:uncharacterized protein LOC110401228 isoform X2 n=1 Tax=Numida meleagris TaxID=8996 RepID=UPI000B3D8491|nr:uncharacterized protein LOC110401228 isoform X2 [Numida meleagris]